MISVPETAMDRKRNRQNALKKTSKTRWKQLHRLIEFQFFFRCDIFAMGLSLIIFKRNLYSMNFHLYDLYVVQELGKCGKKSHLYLMELIYIDPKTGNQIFMCYGDDFYLTGSQKIHTHCAKDLCTYL